MKLREFKEVQDQDPDTLEIGYNNPVKKSDTRRTRLTLEHLNKLRAMRELRLQQQAEERQHYSTIYARAAG
jgi:hypothetical protein